MISIGLRKCLTAGTVAFAILCLFASAPAALAQVPSPSLPGAAATPSADATSDPTDPEALKQAIAVLDDPAKRAELIQVLRTMLAAKTQPKTEQPAADTVLEQGINQIDQRVAGVSDFLVTLPSSFDRFPAILSWLHYQITDGWRNDLWKNELFRLIGILAFGGAALVGTRMALRRRADRSETIEDDQPTVSLRRRLGRVALLAAPPFAFIVVVLILTGVLPGEFLAHRIARVAAWWMAIYTLIVLIAHLLFAPRTASFRMTPVDDALALRTFQRVRLLSGLFAGGEFLFQTAGMLGMPWTLNSFLSHLLNGGLTLLAIVTIQQWRQPIAKSIASLGEGGDGTLVRFLTPRRLAAAWHVLAIAWVVTAYLLWALQIPGGFYLFVRGTFTTIVTFIAVRLLLMRIEVEPPIVSDGPDQPAAKVEPQPKRGYLQTLGPVARGVLAFVIRLVGLLIVIEGWGLGLRDWLVAGDGTQLVRSLTKLAIIATTAFVAWRLSGSTIAGAIEAKDGAGNLRHSARTRTLLQILRNLFLAAIVIIVLLLFLSEIGIDAGPLLAGAGVVGLAIGFGSQKLVQDVIGGSFILLGDTVRVGDVVDIGGKSGVVEGLSIRTVTLRGYNGDVHTVPYSAIEVVTNLTRDFSYAVFEIGIDYDTPVDQAMDIMREVSEKMRSTWPWYRKMLQPLDIAGLDRLADSALIIKARIKVRPGDQWEITREYQRRLRQRFAELGISFPYPARQIVIRDAGDLSRKANEVEIQAAAVAASGA